MFTAPVSLKRRLVIEESSSKTRRLENYDPKKVKEEELEMPEVEEKEILDQLVPESRLVIVEEEEEEYSSVSENKLSPVMEAEKVCTTFKEKEFIESSTKKDELNFYPAYQVAALCGKNISLLFRGSDSQCWPFMWKRANKYCTVYICASCKKLGKEVSIKVKDSRRFLSDPSLNHICIPKNWLEETAKRKIYETMQKVKTKKIPTPKEAYVCLMTGIQQDKTLEDDVKKQIISQMSNYERREKSFARAIRKTKGRSPKTMMEELVLKNEPVKQEEPL